MLNIRYEPTEASAPCPCGCGGQTVSLTRFVEQDDQPVAVCFARYATSHLPPVAAVTLSLGDFAEGSSPADRVAFAMQIQPREEGYELALLDAAQSPWNGLDLIGRTLPRDEAAEHPRLQEAWQLADQVLTHDAVLKRYLRTGKAPTE